MKKALAILLSVVLFATMAFVFPITANATYNYLFPVNNGGVIAYPYGNSASYGGWHDGIDIHSNGDDTIYAACDGVVEATANSCPHVDYYPNKCEHYNTYGNYIRIRNSDETKAYYGHLKQNSLLVSVGQSVTRGQPIASMGSSGYSSGKHLHFELRQSDGKTKINTNPVSSGGEMNYSTTGYGGTPIPIIDDDIYPPNIQSAYVDNITSEGFILNAKISDNYGVIKVVFETWKDGSPDRKNYTANSVGNDMYTYNVNVSDLTNESGVYHSIVHAYDTKNESHTDINIIVPEPDIYPPNIQSAYVDNITPLGFRLNAKISDNQGVTKVVFETWKDGSPDRKNYTANSIGNEMYTYDVNIADLTNESGVYHSVVHAYDTRNESHKDIYIIVPEPDIYPPNIQSAYADNITSVGFRLNAKISDNYGVTKVVFETWKDGSPDRKNYTANSIGNEMYTYDVNIADLTNESGVYHSVVHAFDTRNESKAEIYIIVPKPTEATQPTETEPVTDKPTEPTSTEPTIPTETQPVTDAPTEPTTDKPTEPTQPTSDNPTEPTSTKPTTPTETQPVTDAPTEPTTDKPTDPTQPVEKKDISDWEVIGLTNKVYTGKTTTQKVAVTNGSEYATFDISYKNNINAGNATVNIEGKGNYTGTIVETFKISKAKNPITVETATKTVKLSKVKKAKQTVKPITVSKAQGKVTYKLKSVPKALGKLVKISAKGAITISKWKKAKSGSYKIKVVISAKGNDNYKSKAVTKTVTIKIK